MGASIFLDAPRVVEHGTIAAGLGNYAYPDNSPSYYAPCAWSRGYFFSGRIRQLGPYDRGDDGASHGGTATLGGIPELPSPQASSDTLLPCWVSNALVAGR